MAHEGQNLRVLYIALKHDYGNPSRGFSFEHANFFHTLSHMRGIHLIPFFFDEVLRAVGRAEMNRMLVETARKEKPEVCFFTLFTDEISMGTLSEIAGQSGTQTVNWFTDDHWRFMSFSQFWAPFFTWVVTTDEEAVEEYGKIGCSKVLCLQWACNHFLYKPTKCVQDRDVTFIGRVHSARRKIIEELKAAGVGVQCWGRGWENGRLDTEAMIEMFSRSKINLNFSESSAQSMLKPLAKVFVRRRADGSIHMNTPMEMAGAARALLNRRRPQIKGRNFEVPGSGGFLLTPKTDHLERYYVPDEEIAVFEGTDDLIEKTRYYLQNDEERERVRMAGYERTIRDHTFEQRFRRLFRDMGVSA